MSCTMYRTSNGTFQEKETKLAFKVKKQTKSISSVKFNLAEYIDGSINHVIITSLEHTKPYPGHGSKINSNHLMS